MSPKSDKHGEMHFEIRLTQYWYHFFPELNRFQILHLGKEDEVEKKIQYSRHEV